MALALILRNSAKLQSGALSQNLLKSSSVLIARDFTPLANQNRLSTLNKNNANLNLVKKSQILPQFRQMSADHSKMWPMERAVSLGLLALVPAAIAMPNVVLDNLACVASVMHFHWGFEAIVVDYVRPIIVGNLIPKIALGLLYFITASTLGALIYYNITDIGVGKTIRKFWAIQK